MLAVDDDPGGNRIGDDGVADDVDGGNDGGGPEKIESVTFPCLNQTGEGSLFRFFWPFRVEFKRMGESDSVAIVVRAIASSPWQAPAP